MSNADRWLLPDGVEEVLPPQAARLESTRRRLLDVFASWGYELVVTPMVEFLESLLTGTGSDLDLKTFKVTDQVSGRLMGIRADITPQVARIDAHSLSCDGTNRLCYAGTVVHAKADHMLASRTPISVGAELFGDTGAAGDLEIVSLMIQSIRAEGIAPIHVELGDVGIFRTLIRATGLAADDEDRLFDLVQAKASAELADAIFNLAIPETVAASLAALPGLCGGTEVLTSAREVFAGNADVGARIDSLAQVAAGLEQRFPGLDIYYDLSELRGYAYHTGIVFAAYAGSSGERLGKGGRYDDVGKVFGRARAATGFDIDLKALALNSGIEVRSQRRVLAPGEGDERERFAFINRLRSEGYVVLESAADQDCELRLSYENGQWQLIENT